MIIIKSNKNNCSLDFILNRLDQYEDYFHILGIKYSWKDGEELSQEEERKLDEMVESSYRKNMVALDKMLIGMEDHEKYNEIKQRFQTRLNDAYTALKNKDARKHYIEMLKEIESER